MVPNAILAALAVAIADAAGSQPALASPPQDSSDVTVSISAAAFAVLVVGAAMWLWHADMRRFLNTLQHQRRQLDNALDSISQGLCVFDAFDRLVLCNARYLQMYRLSEADVRPGCTVQDLIRLRIAAGTFAGDAVQYIGDLMSAVAQRQKNEIVSELEDGRIIVVVSTPSQDGGWVATHKDITLRVSAERELARNKAFLDTVIETVPATIFVKDAREFRYRLINRAGERFFGVPRESMLGKSAAEVFQPAVAEEIEAFDRSLIRKESNGRLERRDVELELPGRTIRTANMVRLLIRDALGNPEYIVGVIEDLTERKMSERRIAHMSCHDPLTNLPNRAAFGERLAGIFAEAGANRRPFAVLCVDLNKFKRVNELFGDGFGDTVICDVSRRLRAAAEGAFLARYGADEFALIWDDADVASDAEKAAERLQQAVAHEIQVDGYPLRISASVGAAVFPVAGTDPEQLLASLDTALQRAKADSQTSVHLFRPETDRTLHEQKALRHDLRVAIPRNEFRLHFQPQAMIDGRITGFEALVRWRHPCRGLLGPNEFIRLAEDSGMIAPLGEWVLREACREAASWNSPLRIGVNLSPVQFRDRDLPATIRAILQETGLPAERLELEITEGMLIDDCAGTTALLRQVKSFGVAIAMDDFGTGYSSLSYLQSFPFDKIKIDRAFVANIESNPQSAAIVRAVIGLGRGLDMIVVAEGVETEAQLAILRREQCDGVQGFLIGRPAPISDYAGLVWPVPLQPDIAIAPTAADGRFIGRAMVNSSGAV